MHSAKNEKCNACGGYRFSVNDGFKYCDRCGALFENFEELEEEEGGLQQTVGQGKVKVRKNDDQKRVRNNAAPVNLPKAQVMREALEKRSDFLQQQAIKGEELELPHDATPDYLYRLALRLFSFTQILAKSGHILVHELNFESRVQENILATFQKYLAHCQVAFCHSEQCGNDEHLRFVAVMENLRYEQEEREEKQRKRMAKRGKGVNALSKSAAAWTLLTQGNITEHLDIASDEDGDQDAQGGQQLDDLTLETTQNPDESIRVNDTTMGFVRKVTTALSKEALRRASQLILNLEMLVAILHSALMSSGYQTILTSDVVRWIREDRFRISRRSIRLIRQSQPERMKQGEVVKPTIVDYAEPFLRFPLYEIMRTCTIFHQSLKLASSMAPQSFESMSARLVDNLNLPSDILSRMLILESIIPCDVSPQLLKQVDVDMGYNCGQLAAMSPNVYYSGFLTSFGRKERGTQDADFCDEVLLSPDAKLIAYLLLTLRLTFQLDNAQCALQDDQYFDVDSWIHQLEMRIKCWQGHNMSLVMRSSSHVPEMVVDPPFGTNYLFHQEKGAPQVSCRRRQAGFQKCIPTEMSFNSTSTLPTVFDVRHMGLLTERCQMEALISPVKFQRTVLGNEIERDPLTFENVDRQSKNTFFKHFSAFKTTESCDTFEEYFPCAKNYLLFKRPDWIQNCTARQTHFNPVTGPIRFYLSNQSCDDLLGTAATSFSRRFQFLLDALSLIIGEDKKAVYAAFVMLEMHLTSSERIQSIRDDLLTSSPITLKCQKFRNSTHHIPRKYGVISEVPIDRIENLRYFRLSRQFFEHEEMPTTINMELIDYRNQEIRDSVTETEVQRAQNRIMKLCYEFEQFFGILAVKFW
ncbi:TATA box-binding protein-associated factor RNA polymerase I subunit B [Caenorhabditis elegans]|uniref:TATA box-binding protein-associated factor RNA polymerase I subunit B n=1 Tax=Caenorhabditis elegans TaxID=6239 RepID=TAF1B_CAEEL|nr:TATA box-binding protein-associated factor RNA polymerase I subunit B [Caenorhabditis elegans]O01914.3 RecName: Full=TATA box-binding protein-associated factor RNA polymerase I subunit B; AltName: Full=TATA box-binding protein-associated factor 1B; Short=TBP-associated factor 1B [Caenorhabditis elegans]CCD69943.1 TATA box-binding protein-associated factor RNA polymerase I subunit B [Caenorhabditis elegans]|eukprot:NP_497287.2 TATA box-binding protein-associated factor RNA polymerase I subunit B [Caenorhabditis elegans]